MLYDRYRVFVCLLRCELERSRTNISRTLRASELHFRLPEILYGFFLTDHRRRQTTCIIIIVEVAELCNIIATFG